MAEFTKKGDFNIDRQLKAFMREKKTLPRILGNIAENHFKEGFRKGGGMTNESRGGWKKRKQPAPGRALLVKSGKLRRDVRLRRATFNRIVVGTSSMTGDYANIHNEGGTINHPGGTEYGFKTVQAARRGKLTFLKTGQGYMVLGKTKPHKIDIPQREFIGHSNRLNKKIKDRIYKEINEFMKHGR